VNAWLNKVEKSPELGQEWPNFRECPIGVTPLKYRKYNKNKGLQAIFFKASVLFMKIGDKKSEIKTKLL